MSNYGQKEASLHEAVMSSDETLVRSLIEAGANVNAEDSVGRVPLLLVANRSIRQRISELTIANEETQALARITSLLVEAGADVNATIGDTGIGALHCAVLNYEGNASIVKILLENGTPVNAADSRGNTPLHFIFQCFDETPVELVELLLQYGADVDIKNGEGQTVLELCIFNQGSNVDLTLLRLLSSGINWQEKPLNPLHEACLFHRVETVHRLLLLGADVNAEDTAGRSAMFYAITSRTDNLDDKNSTIKLLLDFSADNFEKDLLPVNNFITLAIYENNCLTDMLVKYAIRRLITREFRGIGGYLEQCIDKECENIFHGILKRLFLTERFHLHCALFRKELESMQKTKLAESTVSFFDLLDASTRKTANYARNKQLLDAFEIGKSQFPLYRSKLEASFYKGLERRKIVERAVATLRGIMNYHHHEEVLIEMILDYCSNEDLMRFID